MCAFVASLGSIASTEEDLKVEKTYVPENCHQSSASGDVLTMSYVGKLASTGEIFDQSQEGHPFTFTLGSGQVIKGWDEGLVNMCVGEKRTLTIPASKGYGEAGSPPKIPGGATLIFDVELLAVSDKPLMDDTSAEDSMADTFKELDDNKDGQITKSELKSYLSRQQDDAMPKGEEFDSLIEDIFKHEDRNKDGVIASDEFGKPHDEL